MVEAEKWSHVGRGVEAKQTGFADGSEKQLSKMTSCVFAQSSWEDGDAIC